MRRPLLLLALWTSGTILVPAACRAGDLRPPARMRFDPSASAVYERTMQLEAALHLDGQEADQPPLDATHTVSMRLRLEAAAGDDPGRLDLRLLAGRLAERKALHRGEETKVLRDGDWPVPSDLSPPVLLRLQVAENGAVEKVEGNWRPLLQEAGCPPKLTKIPSVYFWGLGTSDPPTPAGSFLGLPFPVLPDTPTQEWSTSCRSIYGIPGGLLDDFSLFDVTWAWRVTAAEEGEVRLEGTLSTLDIAVPFSGNLGLELLDSEGSATARLDGASGWLRDAHATISFTASFQTPQGPVTARLRHTETLTRLPDTR